MRKDIRKIELWKNPDHVVKHYEYVDLLLYDDSVGDGRCEIPGCQVYELDHYETRKKYGITPSEKETIERLARELVKDKKHDTYILDLVKGTMIKTRGDWLVCQ